MNSLILAAAVGEEADGLALVLPALPELVYGFLAFTVVFLVARRLAFPQLMATLDERREAIQGKMEAADAAVAEAKGKQAQYEAQIGDAQSEANAIIEEARQQAERVRADVVAKAEEEAAAIRERAQSDAAGERERTVTQLRGEVSALSVELAEKIVGREIDASKHDELVDQYITQLSRNN